MRRLCDSCVSPCPHKHLCDPKHADSLVAQRLRHLPPMQETRVRSLGRKIPWRRKWQSTPVFLPGESHGRRSLVGYSPRGCKESDIAEQLNLTLPYLKHADGLEAMMIRQNPGSWLSLASNGEWSSGAKSGVNLEKEKSILWPWEWGTVYACYPSSSTTRSRPVPSHVA